MPLVGQLSASATAVIVGLCLAAPPAHAAVIRVPAEAATIQDAVDAASPGDQIRVGRGRWCGATITKPVELVAEGRATIIGCALPVLFGPLRIGFFLPNGSASGTTIRNFTFDGRGASNANLDPLAFAVFARNADDVVVEGNTVLGTIQAITNTRGDGWLVTHNTITGFSALTCDGFCGGGDAIVFQERTGASRGRNNAATFNDISGSIPDSLDEFSLVGILVLNQDGAHITNNRIAIPANPPAAGAGQGIVVTDHCCGLPFGFLTSINAYIVNNNGRGSEFAVVIENDAGGGNGNSEGATLRGNFGVNDINGATSDVRNRSVRTLVIFP